MAANTSKNFISDHETVVDLLYYEAIAKTIVTFVRQAPSIPMTVGVHGDWGAGKSSVLKMTEAALAADKRTLCLWFNGWVFEGFEDAKTVVLEKVVTELKRARPTSTKVADAAKRLFKRIQWLKLARKTGGLALTAVTGIPGPELVSSLVEKISAIVENPSQAINPEDVKSALEHAGEFLKASEPSEDSVPEQMHAFREEFEALLKAADIDQLVVLIDDLDRCLPETAIATLEAIRLFLFVPRTAFVIGADEAMIEYSVRRHFPDLSVAGGSTSYTRSYLEKLIQVPFRIPALGFTETSAYITLLLSQSALGDSDARFIKLLEAARDDLRRPWQSRGLDRDVVKRALGDNIPVEVEQALRISGQITRALTDGTRGNPRQIKRFLNSMTLRQCIAQERGFAEDIKLPVLAKLMLAERFATDFYDQLARLATASAAGKVAALARLESLVSPEGEGDTSPPGKGKEKGDAIVPDVEEWSKNDWIAGWAKIEPRIGQIDLRPYVFVTRDKRSYYAGVPIVDHLDALVDRLMGQAMVVQTASAEIEKLTDSDAQQVFDVLKGRILQSEKLNTEPRGVKGLVALVRSKPSLQAALLQLIKDLPEEGLGAWAATSCTAAFTAGDIKDKYTRILQGWQKESKNAALKAAAALALKVKG